MVEQEKWEAVQQEILGFLVEFLHQIEWHYGENRAPIKHPPKFLVYGEDDGKLSYSCTIETDFGEPEEFIRCVAPTPGKLIDEVKHIIKQRFPL